MKTCLFAGPTLYRVPTPPNMARYGPVALGSVFRAVEAGYSRIAIVDGYFGNVPAIWHKEILYALSQGIEVIGAASMGALRAADLWRFGMVGIGRIFRLFRSGRWTDDDEVAVIHADAELAFCPMSDAMANIRFTLRRLRRIGHIDVDTESDLVRRMKARHFSVRTLDELGQESERLFGESRAEHLLQAYEREYLDVKKQDALALLAYLEKPSQSSTRGHGWIFPDTGHWHWQFGTELADIPPLPAAGPATSPCRRGPPDQTGSESCAIPGAP
jgi:hypothetical protein